MRAFAQFRDHASEFVTEDDALGHPAIFLHVKVRAADTDASDLQANFAPTGARTLDVADGKRFAVAGEYGGAHRSLSLEAVS